MKIFGSELPRGADWRRSLHHLPPLPLLRAAVNLPRTFEKSAVLLPTKSLVPAMKALESAAERSDDDMPLKTPALRALMLLMFTPALAAQFCTRSPTMTHLDEWHPILHISSPGATDEKDIKKRKTCKPWQVQARQPSCVALRLWCTQAAVGKEDRRGMPGAC